MSKSLSRREFLKLSGLAMGGLLLPEFQTPEPPEPVRGFVPDFPYPAETNQGKLARIARHDGISLYAAANDTSPIIGQRLRDQVVHVYADVIPDDAPAFYNRLWYRVWGGYVHSAYIQIVKNQHNEPAANIPEGGALAEVTVPYTSAYQIDSKRQWMRWRGSRLYYSSTHWITGIVEGPDEQPWYKITSELSSTEIYYAPAKHLRLIPAAELAPISPEVPPHKKRIEVSIKEQMLRAFEYDEVVMTTRISSGARNPRLSPDQLSTATPPGSHYIYSKMPSKHMGSVAGGAEVEANDGFSLPGVPWTMFFKMPGGYALHGTYWHNNFGLTMSHGCVNMQNEDAKWLFRWTTPDFDPEIKAEADWERTGYGTQVLVL